MNFIGRRQAISDAIEALVGIRPKSIQGIQSTGLASWEDLKIEGEDPQDWIGARIHHKITWATGGGILEAIEILVERATENDNISLMPNIEEDQRIEMEAEWEAHLADQPRPDPSSNHYDHYNRDDR